MPETDIAIEEASLPTPLGGWGWAKGTEYKVESEADLVLRE